MANNVFQNILGGASSGSVGGIWGMLGGATAGAVYSGIDAIAKAATGGRQMTQEEADADRVIKALLGLDYSGLDFLGQAPGSEDAAANATDAFNQQQQQNYDNMVAYMKSQSDAAAASAQDYYGRAQSASDRARGFQDQGVGQLGLATGAYQDLGRFLQGPEAQQLNQNAQQNYQQLQDFYRTGGNVTGVNEATLQMQQLANQTAAAQYGPGMQSSGAYTAAAAAGMAQPVSEYNQFMKNLGLSTLNQQQQAVGLQSNIFGQGIQGRQAVGAGFLGAAGGYQDLAQTSLGEMGNFANIGNQYNSNSAAYGTGVPQVPMTWIAPQDSQGGGTDWSSMIQQIVGLVSQIGGSGGVSGGFGGGGGGGYSGASNDVSIRPSAGYYSY